jgi:hypothetical protein
MTSAYPIELTALTEQVKALAVELGEVPSRNRIKTTFKVGATPPTRTRPSPSRPRVGCTRFRSPISSPPILPRWSSRFRPPLSSLRRPWRMSRSPRS